MDRRNEDKTEADVLHTFSNLFDEVLEDDLEELDAALRAYGYDPTRWQKKDEGCRQTGSTRLPAQLAQSNAPSDQIRSVLG